jgi:hypothetical protein
MTRWSVSLGVALLSVCIPMAGWAATPATGSVSSSSSASWQGGPFLLSNPASCPGSGTTLPGCDVFSLTVAPPSTGHYTVEISTSTASSADDYDLYVYDSAGTLIDSSASSGGQEGVTLSDPPAGTYRVVAQVFLVVPGSTYQGKAVLRQVAEDQVARAFHPVKVGPDFQGTPANGPASTLGAPIVVQTSLVGRNAAEPTIGVNKGGTAFFAAGDFDSVIAGLSRTEVLRSKDGGKTWQSIQPQLILGDTTEPPASLDPYIYLEEDSGRLFSIDLYGGCSWLLYSDNEGLSWHRNIAACGIPVNDHQTLYSAPPPAGISTLGFPEVLYYCFNQVASTACGRSLDGGDTFLPAGAPAFLGVDPTAGGLCGGLSGQLMADNQGRVFLPKGHCGSPAVAVSNDAALTWQQVVVNSYIPAADTHTAVAADAAGNLYYLWFDSVNRLPYLSISTDHGQTWGVPYMIAPPGVHEVNFPAIAAGDAGRIAITFPGTTTRGGADASRPWNSYVLVSTNALSSNPLFVWTTANDPADPVHRGDCGPGRCEGMFDFLDIVASPADGRFWASATDTCTGACVSGQAPADASAGVAIRQLKGPSLWATGHKK